MPKMLTKKQNLFVEHYLKSGFACDAAKKAGYVDFKNGNKLLKNKGISIIIKKHRAILEEKAEKSNVLTVNEAYKLLTREILTAEHSSDRLKALDMFLRAKGEYNHKQQLDVKVENNPITQTLEYMKMRNKEINDKND